MSMLYRLRSWLSPRPAVHAHRSRLAFEPLEARDVPSWLAQIGGPGDAQLRQTAMDSDGNLYVCGEFDQSADFDPGSGTTPHMASAGGLDGYVAKYTPDGALVWARRFGGTSSDTAQGLSLDPAGAGVYVTGQFQGAADFDGDGVADRTSAGDYDVYVLRLAADTGATAWVDAFGSGGRELAGGVAATASGVYATGTFSNTVDFDPSATGVRNLTPALADGKGKNRPASQDAFVVKLDAGGAHLASWQVGGSGADEGRSLVADGDTVYVLGGFTGTVDFGPAAGQRKVSAGYTDFFLARYETAGAPSLNWVQAVGNAAAQGGGQLAGDSTSLYLTGVFGGTLDFDPSSGIANRTAAGTDVFAARYAKADGSLAWARQFGGPGNEDSTVRAVADEASGTVYVGGAFTGSIDLNPGAPGGKYATTGTGDQDGFLVKVGAADGAYRDSWRAGGPGFDGSVRPIGVRGGTLYAAGLFADTATFPTGGSLTSLGSRDLFVMALDQFTAGPAVAGSPVTLTASDFVDANAATTTTEVAFYADANGDGVLDPATDTLLGYGTQTATGTWELSVAFPAAGTYKLFALARDNFGALGTPLALDLQVQ